MKSYQINIEAPEGRLAEILAKLNEAQDTIQQCYWELEELGVLVIKENPPEATGE